MVTLIDVTPHPQAQGPSERFTFWGVRRMPVSKYIFTRAFRLKFPQADDRG